MTHELTCPKCGTHFTVSEADYAAIVQQVRTAEFDVALSNRLEELKQHVLLEQDNIRKADNARYHAELDKQARLLLERSGEVKQLQEQLKNVRAEEQLAAQKSLQNKEKEIADLKIDLKERFLQAQVDNQKQIAQLQSDLQSATMEAKLNEKNIKENYEAKLRVAQEQIDYYKDMKMRLSTKMVGESLEIHCATQFNQLRPFMPFAYFEKDNNASSGSKGDFIFRDYPDADRQQEYISIMFEMKNEMDTTATKHKNEDFFAKLDKDRREKQCEYAVLVSLLEPDSDYYNSGIVDVSHRYEKMYVIRPQFFIPFLTLLVQTSKKTIEYQQQLAQARSQSTDVTHFEEKLEDFKEKFGRNYRLAAERYHKALEEIDKSIDHLQKIKEALISSENNLRLANERAESLTVKRLTRGNPTMQALFEKARAQSLDVEEIE